MENRTPAFTVRHLLVLLARADALSDERLLFAKRCLLAGDKIKPRLRLFASGRVVPVAAVVRVGRGERHRSCMQATGTRR